MISSHENGCKVIVEFGNLESVADNNTCYLSSRYPKRVRAAPQSGCLSWLCYASYYGYLYYRRSLPIKMFASLQYNGEIFNLGTRIEKPISSLYC